MADSPPNKGTVVWLEDVPGEIDIVLERLRQSGFDVRLAEGFAKLDDTIRTLSNDQTKCGVIILDIMIRSVHDLARFYPQISNGSTANGYAAGLVFLERVLEVSDIYPHVADVPVVLNSKRALSPTETDRLNDLRSVSSRQIYVLEKPGGQALADLVEGLLAKGGSE